MTTLMKITTMKRMRMFLAMALGLALTANAGDLAIQSFNGTGQLLSTN